MAQGLASGQADSPLAIELLSSLLDRLGPIGLAIDPGTGRLRVVLDSLGGNTQTLAAVTTVSTVTTVGTVTAFGASANLPQIGGVSANYDQWAQMQSMANANRSRIAVS